MSLFEEERYREELREVAESLATDMQDMLVRTAGLQIQVTSSVGSTQRGNTMFDELVFKLVDTGNKEVPSQSIQAAIEAFLKKNRKKLPSKVVTHTVYTRERR